MGAFHWRRTLARISHQPTAARVHLPESTALRADKGLDLQYTTPARFVSRAPCISGHLRALASRSSEKCGLGCLITGPACLADRRDHSPCVSLQHLENPGYREGGGCKAALL